MTSLLQPFPSHPTSNAWTSNRDTTQRLFPQQTQQLPDGTALNLIIERIRQQLTFAINTKLINFQKILENNTLRINHIFDILNIENGDDYPPPPLNLTANLTPKTPQQRPPLKPPKPPKPLQHRSPLWK